MKPRKIFYRGYKHFCEADYLTDLSFAPFHVADIFDDIDDIAWFSSSLIRNVIDAHAPVKSKTITKQSVPYMNSKLRKAQYARNMARNKFQRFGKAYWEENRRHRNNVAKIRKSSMRIYFEKICKKHDKQFWRTISPFMSDKKFRNGGNIILNEYGETKTDAAEVSEIFNDFFISTASEIGHNEDIASVPQAIDEYADHPSVMMIKRQYDNVIENFDFHSVDANDVMIILKNINPTKATGYDLIPGKLIRIAHRELSASLCHIINTSINSRSFPVIMKCAEVSPVYKNTDNLKKNNYRPVSVLTVISKTYETVLNDQMVNHFRALFNDLLSAFRKLCSCQTLLLRFIEDLKSALDKNMKIGAVFMDLSKAFDCLPHGLLIAKLHAYGLSTAACHLMFSYLKGRRQRVKISNSRSSWKLLTKGVPQGSILGPFLFNVFMNDLFLFIQNCKLYNYADDNSMIYSSPDINAILTNLKHDCKNAIKWFGNNSMEANPDKFQFMVLSSDPLEQQKIEIENDITLLSESRVKLLGVIIDDRLQFNDHISAMCCRAARQLNALARISKHLDSKSKHIIYNSFVASNFNYCPLVWHFCGQVNNNKLEKLQERSLRIIHIDYEASFETLLKCSKQESLLTKRLKIMILEVFKTVNRLNPSCLHDLFTNNEVVYDLRTQKLEQPKRRTTTYGLRTFSYLGSKLWKLLASEYSEVNDIDYERLKFLIKYWAGPNHDSAQGHFLWSTFCVSHVCFRNHYFINLIAHTLRARDCQFDNFVVAGGTVSCHYDNFRCHQWWRGCRADDLLFSEYDIALYILALFICHIVAF